MSGGDSALQEGMTLTPAANDYRLHVGSSPQYLFRTIQPDISPTIDAAATSLCQFTLPALCWNPALSRLRFSLTVPQGGGANRYTFLHLQHLPLASIRLISQTGVVLAEENLVAQYSKVVLPLASDVKEWPRYGDAANSRGGLFRSDNLATASTARQFNAAGDGLVTGPDAYRSWQSHRISGNNVAQTCEYDITGDVLLPFSLLSQNLDLYLGMQCTLQVTFQSSADCAFYAADVDLGGGAIALPAVCTLANVRFEMALQSNPDIASAVISKVMSSGLSLNVPFTAAFQDVSTANAWTKQVKVDQVRGSKLLGYVQTLMANGATLAQRWNTYGPRWTTVQTSLNAVAEQTSQTTVAAMFQYDMDVAYNQSLFTTSNAYTIYGAPIARSYTGMGFPQMARTSNLDAGLSLAQPVELMANFGVKENAQSLWYCWAIVTRKLVINKDGISVLNV